MKPRITVLTLAVDSLEDSVAFYRDGLGFSTEGIIGTEFENGAVAFFELEGGLRLALWPRTSLAKDAGLDLGQPSATELTLGHNVRSQAEVDETMSRAVAVGAKLLKPAGATFWGGYAGYFQDSDGHVWEVVYNPSMLPPEG